MPCWRGSIVVADVRVMSFAGDSSNFDAQPSKSSKLGHWISLLPGWLYLCSGIVIAGSALLVPSWVATQQLLWQKEILTAQATWLSDTKDRYEGFHHDLVTNDPATLEALAIAHLNRVPTDRDILQTDMSNGIVLANQNNLSTLPTTSQGSIDHWLHRPLPRVGRDLPYPPAFNSRLVRITTGDMRWMLFAAAGIFIFVGLLHHPTTPTPRVCKLEIEA